MSVVYNGTKDTLRPGILSFEERLPDLQRLKMEYKKLNIWDLQPYPFVLCREVLSKDPLFHCIAYNYVYCVNRSYF